MVLNCKPGYFSCMKNISKRENAAGRLDALRKEIDLIDKEIVDAFIRRMTIIEKVARLKMENGLELLQQDRWNTIKRTRKNWAKQKKLSGEFITGFLRLMHKESLRIQVKIKTGTK